MHMATSSRLSQSEGCASEDSRRSDSDSESSESILFARKKDLVHSISTVSIKPGGLRSISGLNKAAKEQHLRFALCVV